MFRYLFIASVLITITPQISLAQNFDGGYRHAISICEDSTVQTWGWNDSGQLGDGTIAIKLIPATVPGLTNVIAVRAGFKHTLVLKSDSTVWGFGNNDLGELGDTLTNDAGCSCKKTPQQIAGLTNVIAIAAGYTQSLVLKSDGTVWAFGRNDFGQLGDGTMNNSMVPVQVSGLTGIVQIGASTHSIALKNDSTVWCWGRNQFGMHGDGTTVNHTVPVMMTGVNSVIEIACGHYNTVARKADNTVWIAGLNNNGQVGNGTTSQSEPLAIQTSISDVINIDAGEYHIQALKSDGTVWCWGKNNYGQLGDSTIIDSPSPVQAHDLNNAASLYCGWSNTYALGLDGKMWGWGTNTYGALGDSTQTERHEPSRTYSCTNIPLNFPQCDSLIINCCAFDSLGVNTFTLTVANPSSVLFSYPGFVLFDTNMDTIAIETVNYFGIGTGPQAHTLNIVAPLNLPFTGYLNLYILFSDTLACSFPFTIPDTITSINNFYNASNQISISSNFVSGDVITVITGEAYRNTNLKIEIYDIQGKKILNSFFASIKNSTSDINIAGLSKGLYLVNVSSNGENRRLKFLKL